MIVTDILSILGVSVLLIGLIYSAVTVKYRQLAGEKKKLELQS